MRWVLKRSPERGVNDIQTHGTGSPVSDYPSPKYRSMVFREPYVSLNVIIFMLPLNERGAELQSVMTYDLKRKYPLRDTIVRYGEV